MGSPAIDLSLDIDEISNLQDCGSQWIVLQSIHKLEESYTSRILGLLFFEQASLQGSSTI